MSNAARRSHEVRLPTPPLTLARVIRIAGDPGRPLRDLGLVCAQDPGLTVELLRLANTAREGATDPIRSVPAAVVKLGARAVRAHAIAYSVRTALSGFRTGGFDAEQFWEDSLRRAAAARLIAEWTAYEDPAEAFAVGLVQDLGTLLLAIQQPELGEPLRNLRIRPGQTRLEAERVLGGLAHPAVFAESSLAGMMPDDLLFAVAHHHRPPAGDTRAHRLARIAGAADLLADLVQAIPKDVVIGRAQDGLRGIGIDLGPAALVARLGATMSDLGAELAIPLGPQPTLEEVLAQARALMDQLGAEQAARTERLQRRLADTEAQARTLADTNRQLSALALRDPLTGLANRRRLDDALHAVVSAADRRALGVLVVDIDHFKRVNDTHGHAAGDLVLQSVAQRLCAAVRGCDLVARLGGEEFVILLPDCHPTAAQVVAERLRAAIEASPVPLQPTAIHVTVSVGAVLSTPGDRRGPAALLDAADQALYAAKGGGRNQVRWHTESDGLPAAPAQGGPSTR